MDKDKLCFLSHPLSVPAETDRQMDDYGKHLAHSEKREMQIENTLYIVQSCYIGKDTFTDKIKRLVLRTWEDEQRIRQMNMRFLIFYTEKFHGHIP